MSLLETLNTIIQSFVVPMFIGVFTFATPLLLQTVSRVDDKYGSTLLAQLFLRERGCKVFILGFVLSAVMLILWILQLPRVVDCGRWNYFLEHSAALLFLIVVLVWMGCTVWIICLTYVYYIPAKFVGHLYVQYKSTGERLYFDGVAKILNYSISKADEPLARWLYSCLANVVIEKRKGNDGKVIEYQDEFYDAIYEANELLFQRRRNTISLFDESSLFSLFIDEWQKTEISDKTYHYLWISFLQAIRYDNDDALKRYWEKAHQYASLFFERIVPEYDEQYNVKNRAAIEHQKEIKEKFIILHYALGGLLLYHKKYEVLKYIISWSNQQPPSYVLVPSTLAEVIIRYMDFSKDQYSMGDIYFEQNFPFLELRGVDAGHIIKASIRQYVALLFLRQYLQPNYFYGDPMAMPQLPLSLNEQRLWNRNLDSLKVFVTALLNSPKELKILGFEELLQDDWYSKNHVQHPVELIDSFKCQLSENIERISIEQDLSEIKIEHFKEASLGILNATFSEFDAYLSGNPRSEDIEKIHIIGAHQIIEKDAFVEEPKIGYVNAHAIVAEQAAWNFSYYAQNIFLLMKQRRYLIREEEIFAAIDKIYGKNNKVVIFSIGNNLDYLKCLESKLKKEGENWIYKDIPVINIPYHTNRLVGHSMWILTNGDIPWVNHNEVIDIKYLQKYELSLADEESYIYTSVIDIRKNSEIRSALEKDAVQDIDKKVLACVDFSVDVCCPKSAKAIQLKLYSQFGEQGQVNNLDDVDLEFI